MFNLIIGLIIIVAASYLSCQTLYNETPQKTELMV